MKRIPAIRRGLKINGDDYIVEANMKSNNRDRMIQEKLRKIDTK